MQENRETSAHIGTICLERIEADVRGLVAHFSSHDCMPFPAGPLLPRKKTKEPPLLSQELSTPNRAELARELWPGEEEEITYTNTLNRLHKFSINTWSELHDLKVKIPHQTLLEAWVRIQSPMQGEDGYGFRYRMEEVRLSWQRIMKRVMLTNRPSTRKEPTTGGIPECAYPASAYACDCHKPTHDSCFDEPGTATSDHMPDAASLKQLKIAYTPSALLLRFWLKQLQNHHGFLWKQKTAKSPVHIYHRAALGVLFRLRRTPEHPQAPVAAALTQTHLLPPRDATDAQQWYGQLQSNTVKTDASSRTGKPVKLPDAFCLESLGNPEVSLKEAQLFWKTLGHSEQMLQAVDTLAREVASVMTDPLQATLIDWERDGLERLWHSGWNEFLKPRKPPKYIRYKPKFTQSRYTCRKPPNKYKPHKPTRLHERITPNHRPEDVIDRIRAMSHFVHWASKNWDFLQKHTFSNGD